MLLVLLQISKYYTLNSKEKKPTNRSTNNMTQTQWHFLTNCTTSQFANDGKPAQWLRHRERTDASGGRNAWNPATSSTTPRNIPEVGPEVGLVGGGDHKPEGRWEVLINEAEREHASESDCGCAQCKHGLMEACHLGSHMNEPRQTRSRERLNVHTTGHTHTH